MERNQDESEIFPFLELVNGFTSKDFKDESISDEFIYLIRGESVADSANVRGYGGGPHSTGVAGLADDGQLSSLVCVLPAIVHCCKSCERKKQPRYLPQDLFSDILSHLPARVLHGVMRYVCKEWNLMIRSPNFIYHHLRNSASGILIQEESSGRNGIYVEMRGGSLEICKFDWGFDDIVWTSCNGLVLAPDFRDLRVLYVINPLTKQRAVLPPYFFQIRSHAYFSLAFVEASMEYKVVHAFGNGPLGLRMHIVVLTIGVDKIWRHIDIEHLSFTTSIALMFIPVVTGAYVHWIGATFVLTLNVETETIRRFPLPRLGKECENFLPMGSNLSLLDESSELLWDVWEMNPKTGKWIKLLRFDLGPLSSIFPDLFPEYLQYIIPFGWLVVREVLFFNLSGVQSCCVAYNLKTREIHSFQLDIMTKSHNFQTHVNSLVWLEGGF